MPQERNSTTDLPSEPRAIDSELPNRAPSTRIDRLRLILGRVTAPRPPRPGAADAAPAGQALVLALAAPPPET
jgi:hypothetical protein